MNFFQRIEQKYILTEEEYKLLFEKINSHLEKDYYYKSTICNLYFDTDYNDLIVNSLEKPPYKQKVRVRSYNVPNVDDNVFLELKGKHKGIVFKRREKIRLDELYKYLESGTIPKNNNNQMMKEIDYIIKKYNLKPKIFLAYDRLSYYDKDNVNFRVTFDMNLRSRNEDLNLELGDTGKLFSKEKFYIMELKSLTSIPLWFIKVLSELKIYSRSFSKYGSIYSKQKEEYLNV